MDAVNLGVGWLLGHDALYRGALDLPDKGTQRLARPVVAVLLVLVLYRCLYHCIYLAEVPFSLATFSDGRNYELAALDLLAHRPWGSEPFYLQGLYALQLALPMAIRPWISLALLTQLLLVALTLWWFFRVAVRWLGRREAGWAMIVLLSCPMLAFYENKFLTGALAVTASVFVLWAAVRAEQRPEASGAMLVLGAALGFAVLARPNFAVVLPFAVAGCWFRPGPVGRWRRIGLLVLGAALSLAPMAIRNTVVTGHTTVLPAHGGGTSFYIGNNAKARGVWNTAGGLLSADVSHEREELCAVLGVSEGQDDASEIAAIGDALYRRGFEEIKADPSGWVWLELRKLWLMLGNDELTQDYDVYGEREMLLWSPRGGIPFGVLWVLGAIGAVVAWRRGPPVRAWSMPVWAALGLTAATIVANLLYFTSAQHRLPLVVPLALAAPGGARWLWSQVRARRLWGPIVAAVLIGLCAIPRSKQDEPTAIHYYNLSLAWVYVGDPARGLEALDRAVQRRPDHPVIRFQRAKLRRDRGLMREAREDLDALETFEGVPGWIRTGVAQERSRLAAWGL